MNPFLEKSNDITATLKNWQGLNVRPYEKTETDAFTKTRVILMNGTEFEQNWFLHSFIRHCSNNDLRRDLAYLLKLEQQQQKVIASLKPISESILETTIGFEQLAVDLTAALAQNEPDENVRNMLNFALLEDFDHLYRYANLLDMDMNIKAENLVGRYTEIMPARPTISEHRHPYDDVKKFIDGKTADLITKLNVNIITAAEQQTMNYYMNVGQFYENDLGRALYTEIAMVEVQHVTGYGSLIDPNCTWLESLLMHQYVECYLYYSCLMDETDEYIKLVWDNLFREELAHLEFVSELLKRYEGKQPEMVIPNATFPVLLKFKSNIDYVRDVIKNTVSLTGDLENYVNVGDISKTHRFHAYQDWVNNNVDDVASHDVIKTHIDKKSMDYRFMTKDHPIDVLNDRMHDNTSVGRYPL